MSKTAVVYWSGTGNTEAMAAAVVFKRQNAQPLFGKSSVPPPYGNPHFLGGAVRIYKHISGF